MTSRKHHGLHVCDNKQKVHRIFVIILGGAMCYLNIHSSYWRESTEEIKH